MSFSERKKNAFLKFFFLSYIIPKPKSEHSYMSKKPLKGRTQKHLHVTLTLWLISFSQSRSQLGPKSQLVQFPFSLDLTRHNSVELWLHITLIWTTWVAYKSNAFFLPFYHHLLSLSLSFFFFFWFVYLVCALYYGTSWEVNQAFTTDVSIVVLCSFRLKQNIKIWVCLSPSNMCSSIIVHSKPK